MQESVLSKALVKFLRAVCLICLISFATPFNKKKNLGIKGFNLLEKIMYLTEYNFSMRQNVPNTAIS